MREAGNISTLVFQISWEARENH